MIFSVPHEATVATHTTRSSRERDIIKRPSAAACSAARWFLLTLLAGCSAMSDENGRSCPPGKTISAEVGKDDLVWVPGGETIIGSENFHAEEAPKRRVQVKGFWIDRQEVTNAEFAAFVKATGYRTSNERNGGGAVFRSPGATVSLDDITQWWYFEPSATWRHPHGASGAPAQPLMPVVQVTYADALAYARWRKRDLPTEVEWERAARGGMTDAEYSWGNRPEAKQSMANTWQGIFPIRDAGSDGFKGLAQVGCFPPNGYGLHDMAGNVWELTSTAWPGGSRASVIKGGSWLCADSFCLRYRPAARQPADDALGTDHIGFRTVVRAS